MPSSISFFDLGCRATVLVVVAFAGSRSGGAEIPHSPPVLLQMIRDEAIHDELRLSQTQRNELIESIVEVDGPWFRARNLDAESRDQQIDQLTHQLETRLKSILHAKQFDRLKQLQRQALGTRMFLRDELAKLLELSDRQKQVLVAAFAKTDSESASIQTQLREQQLTDEAADRKIEQLKTDEKQVVVSQLSEQQKAKLLSLTGRPFDFSKIRRTYPHAPELTTAGVQWIQGGPLRLADLRGKVVVVHFYAFQCINCIRNLPHYNGWHQDYADRDLVVIGIQTPELAAERQLDRVAAAVETSGIQYPVMLDASASNWKEWSNTMWPTVYLIDKQGFLRRWWQGELNWKGATGEQQFRDTIEQLLEE